jgi:hypothetical protein
MIYSFEFYLKLLIWRTSLWLMIGNARSLLHFQDVFLLNFRVSFRPEYRQWERYPRDGLLEVRYSYL